MIEGSRPSVRNQTANNPLIISHSKLVIKRLFKLVITRLVLVIHLP